MALRVIRPRVVVRFVFCALVFACLGGATPLYGQVDACDRPGGKRGDGEDLKCRMGMLLDKQQTFLEKSKANLEGRCPQGAACDKLKKNMERAEAKRSRAKNAHDRATVSDYEDLTVKGNGKRKKKGGGASSMDQTMQQQEEEEEPPPDPAIGADIADELDEAIEALDDANEALDSETESGAVTLSTTAVSPKFEASYGYGRSERTGPGWAMTVFIAFRVSHTLAAVSDNFCDQTVVVGGFGGNFSSGCAAFFWAAEAFETIHETLKFLDDDINAAEIEGGFERAGQVYDIVSDIKNTTNAIESSTDGTEAEIKLFRSELSDHDSGVRRLLADLNDDVHENQQQLRKLFAVQRQIIRLLLQADGKRTVNPNVLTCTGANCPVVLDCPGTECSFPIPK